TNPRRRACHKRNRRLSTRSSAQRSLRLSVRTPGFQPGKRGSIPLGTATRSFLPENSNAFSAAIACADSLCCVLDPRLKAGFRRFFEKARDALLHRRKGTAIRPLLRAAVPSSIG